MSEKNRNWHGVDCSNEVSLFEYGFLMRWRPEYKDYQVIHLCGFDGNGGMLFDFSSFDYKQELEYLKEDKGMLHDLSKMCGMTEEEYMQCMSPTNLANDKMLYYGIDSTFGSSYGGLTEKEIRKRLGRALCA